MKLNIEQLAQQLQKKPLPGYWLASDEIFLQQIAADLIRDHLKNAGFTQRLVFQVEAGFNFEAVFQEQNHLSLFSDKQIIELHLGSNKFTETERQALQTCVKNLSDEVFLLILSSKIEQQMQKAKWFQAITDVLGFVPIWPVAAAQYPAWLKNRALHHQVQLEMSAVDILAKQTQGNFLAADQMLQQLKLLHHQERVTAAQVTELAHQAAQTDLFAFVDVFLTHNKPHVFEQLQLLKQQQVEPILIIWAIARELRLLHALSLQIEQGLSLQAAMQAQHVWPSRQMLLSQARQYFSKARIQHLIKQLAVIDLQIKGVQKGDPWISLEHMLCFE